MKSSETVSVFVKTKVSIAFYAFNIRKPFAVLVLASLEFCIYRGKWSKQSRFTSKVNGFGTDGGENLPDSPILVLSSINLDAMSDKVARLKTVKTKYSCLIYMKNIETVKLDDIKFTLNDQLLLDTLLT